VGRAGGARPATAPRCGSPTAGAAGGDALGRGAAGAGVAPASACQGGNVTAACGEGRASGKAGTAAGAALVAAAAAAGRAVATAAGRAAPDDAAGSIAPTGRATAWRSGKARGGAAGCACPLSLSRITMRTMPATAMTPPPASCQRSAAARRRRPKYVAGSGAERPTLPPEGCCDIAAPERTLAPFNDGMPARRGPSAELFASTLCH
jgi:hypothetical protein